MKLRFRQNSLRLRLNRREVEALAASQRLKEQVRFPGGAELTYVLESLAGAAPEVDFKSGVIRVALPAADLQGWAGTQELGLYFELPANGSMLKIAVEKDLECVDEPPEERDPDAYPRKIC
jgi:hypothetical protein